MIESLAANRVPLDTSALDCVAANLVAAAEAGPGWWLGAGVSFRPRPADSAGPDAAPGLLTIEPTLSEQLSAARVLGVAAGDPHAVSARAELIAALDDNWLFVIADAFELPWVPYYQHTHTNHSFLLRRESAGVVELLDAYTNDTPWGRAQPTVWRLTTAQLDNALPEISCTATTIRRVALDSSRATADSARSIVTDLTSAASDGRVADYVDSYAGQADQAFALTRFTVETWLLARHRLAFAGWIEHETTGLRAEPARARAIQWREAAESVYLAMRRSQRGREVPPGVIAGVGDLLAGDGDALAQCLDEDRVTA